MRKIYSSAKQLNFKFLLLLGSLLLCQQAFAQTTVTTGLPSSASSGSGANQFLTFCVENTTASPIIITDMEMYRGTGSNGNTFSLYYSSTSLSGTTGYPSTAWTFITDAVLPTISTTAIHPLYSGMSFVIPASTTYRFLVASNGTSFNYGGAATTPNNFTNGGVSIYNGNYQINSMNVGYWGATNPRFWCGSITFIPAVACTGTPNGGSAVANPQNACASQTIDLSLTGATLALGLTYQWQQGTTASGPWTNIGTSSSSANYSHTLPATVGTYYYRCQVSCAANSAFSVPVAVTAGGTFPGGTYTINSALPTAGSNFNSFSDAANAMKCGITGSVVFNVTPGTYTDQLHLGNIPGTSAINTIKFNGNGATLQYNHSAASQGVLMLDGTSYVKIDSLTFKTLNATNGSGAFLTGNCSYDSITRCTFDLSGLTSTSSTNFGIRITTTTTGTSTAASGATNSYFAKNKILGNSGTTGGPYYGAYIYGPNNNNIYENNTFENFYIYGVYLYYANNVRFRNNTITRKTKTPSTYCYGTVIGVPTAGSQITGNRIEYLGGSTAGSTYCYPLQVISAGGTAANPVLVANNMITNMTTVPLNGGIYINSGNYVHVYHNTVDISYPVNYSTTTVQAGIQSTSTTASIVNNTISYTGGGTNTKYGVYYTNNPATSNYNNIYMNSTQAGTQYHGYAGATAYATHAAFQAGTVFEVNGVSADPQFASPTTGDFTPGNSALIGAGTNLLSVVPLDINETPRSANPTLGAVEAAATLPNNANISQTLGAPTGNLCAGQQPVQVTIGNSGTNNLTSLQIGWSINGVNQTPYSWTGTLLPPGSSPNTAVINLGNGNFPSGTNDLKVWTFSPNNVPDTNPENDTLTTTVTPTVFTVSTSMDTICIGSTAMMSLSPDSGYDPNMIQWQSSSTPSSFTSIPSATTPQYTSPALSSPMYYRVFINSGTNGCYSDTLAIQISNPGVSDTMHALLCAPGTAIVGVTPNPGVDIEWFDAPTGGTSLGTGSSLVTPFISSTTTYYAEPVSGSGGGALPELMYYRFDAPGNTVLNEALTPVGVNPAPVTGLTIGGSGQFGTGLQGAAGPVASNNVDPGWTGTHTGSWTISFWMNVPTPPTTRYMFGNSTGGGTFRCFIGGAANGIRLTGGTPSITLDMPAWTAGASVITYVYDQTAGTVSGYINGVFQTSVTPGASYPLTGTNFYVGAQGTSIDGTMDEFRMYNRALTAAEIAATWNVTLGQSCVGERIPVVATVGTPPVVNLGNDTSICTDGSVNLTLNAGTANSYLWDNSSTNQTRTVNTTGTYWVEAENDGCYDRDTIIVTFNNIPVVNLGNDTSFCDGPTLLLNAGNPGSTYLWDDNSTSQTRSVNSTGNYYVTVTGNGGCSAADSMQLTVHPNPVVNLGGDTSICLGQSVVLNAGNPGSTYLWDNSANTQTRAVNTSGTYHVKVTTTNGCEESDTVTVQVVPAPTVNLGPDVTICQGTSVLLNAGNPGSTYLWEDFSTGQTRNITTSGTYHVLVTNNIGCMGADTVVVNVIPSPVVNLGNDLLVCDSTTLVLDAGNPGATYLWDDNSTGQTRVAVGPGTYYVEATYGSGCKDSDTLVASSYPPASANIMVTYQAGLTYQFMASGASSSYVWDFGDGSPTVVGNPVMHTYSNYGGYIVTLTIFNECGDKSFAQERLHFTNGIDELETANLVVYPNPATDWLTIEHRGQDKIERVTLYTIAGAKVMEQNIDGTQHQIRVPVDGLSNGVYMLSIQTNNGVVQRKVSVNR